MSNTAKTTKNTFFILEPQHPLVERFERAFRREKEPDAPCNELIGADGTRLSISDDLFNILKQAVPLLETQRTSVTISPAVVEFTTQQAADTLNVSRPFLIKLLEKGDIPFIMVGTHRRINREDLETYKLQRDTQRGCTLDKLTALMEEEEEFFN